MVLATTSKTATVAVVAEANQILSEWETTIRQQKSNNSGERIVCPTTAIQLYQLGLVLHTLSLSQQYYNNRNVYRELQHTLDEMVSIIPIEFKTILLNDLSEAFQSVVINSNDDEANSTYSNDDAINKAIYSMSQLYEASNTIIGPYAAKYFTIETLTRFVTLYSNKGNNENNRNDIQISILLCLKHYLFNQTDFEQLLLVLHLLQDGQQLWDDLVTMLNKTNSNWKQSILLKYESDQQEYLMSFLSTSGHTEEEHLAQTLKQAVKSVGTNPTNSNNTATLKPATTPEQELQRRIDQVKNVLSSENYGDGFIEAALSYYRGDVEQTVNNLLLSSNEWPVALQRMDPQLPRKFNKSTTIQQEEEEAKRITKEAILANEKQQEKQALLLDVAMKYDVDNEYNDDYDDQYDDIDGGDNVGNADTALYDNDNNYEAVRTYNQIVKGMEAEQSFWEENKNTNRNQQPPKKNNNKNKKSDQKIDDDDDDDDDEEESDKKNYRGPDKMRGGRIPGGRGGGRRGGGGRGGRGRGRGGGSNKKDDNDNKQNDTSQKQQQQAGKPNLKQKARKLDKRREQQKKAQVQRSGA